MPFLRRFLPVVADAQLEAPDPGRPIPLYDPEGVLGQINRTLKRRLGDRVEDLFQDACIAGDLDTAEELLTVLENMQNRRDASGQDRRVNDDVFAAAREELARRRKAAERKRRRE
jgi:hypothetical protein